MASTDAGQLPRGAWSDKTPGFTQQVVQAMQKLYPEELADRSWDNVGLLVDNAEVEDQQRRVLLTNDLTYAVAEDAIAQNVSVIVSYHPIIFSGLKAITKKDPQQATLLRLIQHKIAVYCPHTAVDAHESGLSNWLVDVVAGDRPLKQRKVVGEVDSAPEGLRPAGPGKTAIFSSTEPLKDIVKQLAQRLGGLRHVMVALPVGSTLDGFRVGSFAVCAGSGYDVFKNEDVDLFVTGEVSHHSALRAIQQGRALIQVFHSNSERQYLKEVLAPRLETELQTASKDVEVIMSRFDQDPFTVIDVNEI